MCVKFCVLGVLSLITASTAQRDVALPLSADSFRQIFRTFSPVPEGRSADLSDVRIRCYGRNSTKPTAYRLGDAQRLLSDPQFDNDRPTTLYIHGYVELWSDPSVSAVARAYRRRAHNLLVLDWGNLGFGNYVAVGLRVEAIGLQAGKALWRLLRGGLALARLHVVGHSMGVGIAGVLCRYLAAKGLLVPRLTGLDPAYPGFYPALLAPPATPSDAAFVDTLHTDGGGYGAPLATGHADYWPNAGAAKQPGCLPLTLPLTTEDFCSHWRSWQYWAEAVASAEPVFLARACRDYDAFLRGECRAAPLVVMGLETDTSLVFEDGTGCFCGDREQEQHTKVVLVLIGTALMAVCVRWRWLRGVMMKHHRLLPRNGHNVTDIKDRQLYHLDETKNESPAVNVTAERDAFLVGFISRGVTSRIRGNFYLRTAAREPFALGERGAD